MNQDNFLDQPPKHIVWIGKESSFSNTVCQWTFDWMCRNGIGIDSISRSNGLEMAIKSLETPLKIGVPPEMVIVDRSVQSVGVENFSSMIHDCIPECWVVELVSAKDVIHSDGAVIYIQRPFKKQDWLDLLNHCFVDCPNPQWSRSFMSQ